MNVEEWKLDRAIVLCEGNVSNDSTQPGITYMPWYMTMFITQPKPEPIIVGEL
ncbi:hypothetical protein JS530_02185 [Bifidobacterium sp. LC6]|uniref:Uncharacterized protein n=1 Tax=Bifidobacterium colobi TaxID=2809026 RepID=A0ABS5UTF5_9BIFI|nr:hypothetical protein [Bifidobacterium colobi]MBT1174330.1 hypothetical protein [Bifidobacterium colobi]